MCLISFSTEITMKDLRVLIFSHKVKCIRFVMIFAVDTLIVCSKRLVAYTYNFHKNNFCNNKKGSYCYSPFYRLENENQWIKPWSHWARMETQVFFSESKVLSSKPALLKSVVQNHPLKITCDGFPSQPIGSKSWGPGPRNLV